MDEKSNPNSQTEELRRRIAELEASQTELKQVEEALRKSDETAQALLNAPKEPAMLLSLESIILALNETAAKTIGKSPEKLIGTCILDYFPPELAKSRQEQIGKVIHTRREIRYEDEMAGTIYDNVIYPVFNTNGEVDRIAVFAQDITARKRAEEELSESEERFRSTFDQAAVGIAHVDPDGHFIRINPQFCDILGYSREEMLERTFQEITYPDDLDSDLESVRRMLSDEIRTSTTEKRYFRKDSSIVWVNLTVSLLRGPSDDPKYFIAVVEDITKNKLAQEDIQASARQWDTTFNAISDAVCLLNSNNIIEQCNEAMTKIVGKSFDDIIGKSCWEIVHGTTGPVEGCPFERMVKSRHKETMEISINDRIYNVALDPVLDDEGNITGAVHIISDITDRKQVEEELAKAKALLSAAIEQSPAGILIADAPDVKIRIANRAALGIRGETSLSLTDIPLELHPRNWEAYHPDGTPYMPEDLPLSRAVLKGETSRNVDVIIRRQNGEDRWVLGNAAPVRNAKGEIIAGIVVFPDITELKSAEGERKTLEEQLRQSQKLEAIGQLAGGVAHDFGNILQAIICSVKMAVDFQSPNSKVHESLEDILKSAQRAAALIRQLLIFSRRETIAPQEINLNELTKNLLRMLERIIGEDIELDFKPDQNLGSVLADSGLIEQILLNLSVNSRDAMPEGGRIDIETQNMEISDSFAKQNPWARQGRYVVLKVSDTGIGMSPKVQEHIFEPFYTTKRDKGTGLGLATVYGIVQKHNGFIHLDSEVGKGTTFQVYLPMAGRSAPIEKEEIEKPSKGGHETLLITEDDVTLRKMLARVMKREGYTVITASDGEEAAELFESEKDKIDLVLLDVVMPKLSGSTVYDRIREVKPHVPILFSSGYSPEVLNKDFLKRENIQIIRKPFFFHDLLRKVRYLLDKRPKD